MAFDKVVDSVALGSELKNLADILREKSGTAEQLDFYAGDFSQTAESIETGDEARAIIETAIDESGVLDNTEGTVEEKVDLVIEKAEKGILLYDALSFKSSFDYFFDGSGVKKFPRLNFEDCTSMQYFCRMCSNLESIDYYINCSKCTDFHCAFDGCWSLNFIYGIDTSSAYRVTIMFRNCGALETIQEPLNFSSVTDAAKCFDGCRKLTDIKFVPETIKVSVSFAYSSELTAESVQSIIGGLATIETAQTLTLNSAIVLTDEQKATINSKGWTLVQ